MAGAGILANGVTEILKKLCFVVANEVTLVRDFKEELKNLQSTLNMILTVMEDAEKKQLSKAAVKFWMKDLKAIAYDAEDVLDDYSYEIIRKRTQTGEVRKPSPFFRTKMAHKIKEINEKFNKIAKRKNDLELQTVDVGSSSSSSLSDMNMMMKNRETNSLLVKEWKTVGRDNDKSNIIKMLLEDDDNSSNNQGGSKHVSVIPIVGMGGLGKTTMAQLVYNDEAVKRHFDIKVWICVSDPFDVKKLLKNIVNSALKSTGTDKIFDDAATMDDIVLGLHDAFRGKKFLLVLDDVWNENFEDWHKLKTPLMVGAEGSKILVTTRMAKVAELVKDKFPHYDLGKLNEDDCWFLFKEIAFGSAAGAEETPNLVKIGKELVNRCKGLPLGVIFLGSMMRSKKKEEEWKIIQNTKIWHEGKNSTNEILPSLRLSYDNLPSHLKLCFSYCCLFPKDWIIERKRLIRLWMAEGFLIESPGENAMSMEEIGNEYFQSLVCNFFFQDIEKNGDGDVWKCKMHDLVHDLARSVVEVDECLIVESDHDITLISEKTRRLNLVNLDEGKVPKVLEALKKAKNLRTVFVNKQRIGFDIGNAFNENGRLRVLDLSGSDFEESTSSSSIGGLKHLRYLDVKGDVRGLQLSFSKGIIGRLSFLQTLHGFTVGDKKKKKNACGVEELEGLNLLRGDLSINGLENVTSETDACRANLKEKKKLRGLHLCWRGGNNHEAEAVLEGLRPNPNLRSLRIVGFKGSKLPRWIEDSSCLPNLVGLVLFDCKCEQVAGFGALPSLRSLILIEVDVECIGNEFYYSAAAASGGSSSSSAAGGRGESSSSINSGEATTTTTAFPSLKKLMLHSMVLLKEWVVPVPTSTSTGAPTCFPLLEEITIKWCPVFTTITPTTTIFPSLKVLFLDEIDGSAEIKTLVTNNLNSLTSLRLNRIHNLTSLPRQGLMENNNTLLSLYIVNCHQFKGFLPPNMEEENENDDQDDDDDGGGGQQLQISQVVSSSTSSTTSSSSLQSLKLYDCPALRVFPDIRSLTSLRKLVIQECKESRSLQDELTCLSSSSSSSSLGHHLKHVKILKHNTDLFAEKEVVFEWRKPSSSSFKEEALMHDGRHTLNMMSFKGRLNNIGMRCWWFPCYLLGLEGMSLWDECRCVWRMLLCLCLWLAALLCIGAPFCSFS